MYRPFCILEVNNVVFDLSAYIILYYTHTNTLCQDLGRDWCSGGGGYCEGRGGVKKDRYDRKEKKIFLQVSKIYYKRNTSY